MIPDIRESLNYSDLRHFFNSDIPDLQTLFPYPSQSSRIQAGLYLPITESGRGAGPRNAHGVSLQFQGGRQMAPRDQPQINFLPLPRTLPGSGSQPGAGGWRAGAGGFPSEFPSFRGSQALGTATADKQRACQ